MRFHSIRWGVSDYEQRLKPPSFLSVFYRLDIAPTHSIVHLNSLSFSQGNAQPLMYLVQQMLTLINIYSLIRYRVSQITKYLFYTDNYRDSGNFHTEINPKMGQLVKSITG